MTDGTGLSHFVLLYRSSNRNLLGLKLPVAWEARAGEHPTSVSCGLDDSGFGWCPCSRSGHHHHHQGAAPTPRRLTLATSELFRDHPRAALDLVRRSVLLPLTGFVVGFASAPALLAL